MRTLNNLNVGERCVIKEISTKGSMRRRFIDIGLIENTIVECVGESPAGNPKAYLIRGAVIAVRNEDCAGIMISSQNGGEQYGTDF